MSSFTYLSKAAVVLAAAAVVLAAAAAATTATTATETEGVIAHIRRLCSSSDEEYSVESEMNRQMYLGGCTVVGMLVGVFILVLYLCCVDRNPDDHQQASVQPAPKRILPLMSIEPALKFTKGLSFAGGADHPECTVCLSEFSEGEEIRILLNCGHGFHLKCIEDWLSSQSSCPTCRTSCVKAAVENNPPENQHDDLEAAHPPAVELMILQQHH